MYMYMYLIISILVDVAVSERVLKNDSVSLVANNLLPILASPLSLSITHSTLSLSLY